MASDTLTAMRRIIGGRAGKFIVVGALSLGAVATTSSLISAADPAIDDSAGGGELAVASRLTPPPAPPTPPPAPPGVSVEEQRVLELTNAERALRGVAPLTFHPQLAEAADAHAADQFNQGCSNLSHTGRDGSNPGTRIGRTALRVRTWGENIACGYRTPDAVMQGWMNSTGHRNSILNSSFTHIGISYTLDADGRTYWVQVFGTPR